MSADVLGHWVPDRPEDVAAVFAKPDFPWWIAGGYAIELAVGRHLRPHGDLDILVLRRDQALVRDLLAGWDLYVADPPGQGELRPWRPGEVLRPPLHDIWCRRTPEAPWSIQIMVDEAEGTQWVSRRDPEVRLPIDRLGRTSETGVPYLAPEVQLFYKAKATREKDEIDFEAVLPLLGLSQRVWLADAIKVIAPDHPWLRRLLPISRT
ncbi:MULTISPECIES: nucleotidyltransferase domain-containing protein [Streptomyces]|uniref:Amino acid transporter n=1 Tax=Streptomyces dengpaensis TaxID=2049881 RepID=A0ABN5IEU2_9ACTN|nr:MULTISPECIES: amino acid transporter [Streptomyces]AVH60840.1 amino acid transporter [Streptomyces dengpaensis]PIB02729.1 amino acid transporter [Streptomyces sp. HG99]